MYTHTQTHSTTRTHKPNDDAIKRRRRKHTCCMYIEAYTILYVVFVCLYYH